MQLSFITISSLLALAGHASAHGFVASVVIDGKTYPGANGPMASSSSPVRLVSAGSPVQNLQSQDLVCGLSAQAAPSVASANPGSAMQFYWTGEGGGNWFHNTGPIQTFMAKCDGDCTSFTPSGSTAWFKISELGEKQAATPGTWVQADTNSGAPVNITMPSNIAAGSYLMRHEMIALQNGQTQGGAEFYPSCLQVTVGGSQSGSPDKTVAFPGAYSPTDPGILGNFYNPGGQVYTFPGGPVSSLKDPLSDTNDAANDPSPVVTPSNLSAPANAAPTGAAPTGAPAPSAPAAAAPPSPSGSCKLKRRTVAADAIAALKQQGISAHRKRRLGRH